MSFADATYIEPANASGGAVGADKNLIPDGVEAKKLMAANDANVAAAEQALALCKRTPTDHWWATWATIKNFQRKLDEAKQKRDNDRRTIHDTFKQLMAANDANVAAAEQALALYKRTPTDHWWATIENFTKKALLRKLDEAKQKRDNAFWTIHDTSLFRFDSEHFSYVD